MNRTYIGRCDICDGLLYEDDVYCETCFLHKTLWICRNCVEVKHLDKTYNLYDLIEQKE